MKTYHGSNELAISPLRELAAAPNQFQSIGPETSDTFDRLPKDGRLLAAIGITIDGVEPHLYLSDTSTEIEAGLMEAHQTAVARLRQPADNESRLRYGLTEAVRQSSWHLEDNQKQLFGGVAVVALANEMPSAHLFLASSVIQESRIAITNLCLSHKGYGYRRPPQELTDFVKQLPTNHYDTQAYTQFGVAMVGRFVSKLMPSAVELTAAFGSQHESAQVIPISQGHYDAVTPGLIAAAPVT